MIKLTSIGAGDKSMKAYHRKTGIFFASLMAALLFTSCAYWLYSKRPHYKTYQLFTRDNIHGMIVSSPVEMLGVEIGSVKKIDLVNAKLVKILIAVDANTPIDDDTAAQITTKGLAGRGFTGYVYVTLKKVSQDSQLLNVKTNNNYPTIPTLPSVNHSIDAGFIDINKNVTTISSLIAALLDDKTIKAAHNILRNIDRLSRMLASNNSKLNRLIANSETASNYVTPLLKTTSHALVNVQSQLLPELFTTLSNVNTLSTNVTSTVKKIDNDPSIVIRGVKPATLGPGEIRRR
jgi:phospholipid/cholesterol/gamma-HCH transport system substrate-binding protein